MNLTWHIVKKDLRALKWPLLVWLLIIVAKLGIGIVMLTSVGTVNADWYANWFAHMDDVAKVMACLECISFVLVAAVVHEDVLVGTTAFWMTRPIAGARLLAAKFLAIGLVFLVLPVLVTLPWWLGCGFGWREIAWAALETSLVQLLLVLLGLLWAVVTDGFARFLLWTLVLLFAVPSVSSAISLRLLKVKPTTELLLSRFCVVITIGALAILVVVVHQFLTRRTWRSVVIICSSVGLIVLVGLWWPWDLRLKARFDAHMMALTEANAFAEQSAEPAELKFTVEAPRLLARPGVPFERLNTVQINFNVTGIPDTQLLVPQGSSYTLHWLDGTSDFGYGGIYDRENAIQRGAARILGLPTPGSVPDDQQNFTCNMSLPVTTLSRIHAEKPSITTRAAFHLLNFDSTTKFPLQPGARMLTKGQGERVARVETMDGQILVSYIKSRPDFFVGEKLIYPFPRVGGPYSFYAVVNQAAGRFDLGRTLLIHRSRIASVEVALQVVAYGNKAVDRKNVLAETWLRDAELSRQTYVDGVRFTHQLGASQFPTETTNP